MINFTQHILKVISTHGRDILCGTELLCLFLKTGKVVNLLANYGDFGPKSFWVRLMSCTFWKLAGAILNTLKCVHSAVAGCATKVLSISFYSVT